MNSKIITGELEQELKLLRDMVSTFVVRELQPIEQLVLSLIHI